MPGRKPGSRLTKRKVKREIAKSTRTTKYADQKGGGSKTKSRAARGRSDKILDTPRYLQQEAQQADEEEEDRLPAPLEEDKAIRAFTKKLRQIEDLKQRKQKGETLNDEQLDKIGQEKAVLQKIVLLTAPKEGEEELDKVAAAAARAPKRGSPKGGAARKRRKA